MAILQHPVRVLHRRAHGRRRLNARGNAAQKRVVHVRGQLELSLPLEEARLVQQRRVETRVGSKRLLERIALRRRVVEFAMRQREVEPEHRAGRVERSGPLEQRTRRTGIAGEQRAHAGYIEHAGVIRRRGPRLRQRALGFAAVACLVRPIDGIDERADLGFGGGRRDHGVGF